MQHSKDIPADSQAATEIDDLETPEAKELTGRQRLYKSEEGYEAIMAWYADVLEMIDTDVSSKYVPTRFGRTRRRNSQTGIAVSPPMAPPT